MVNLIPVIEFEPARFASKDHPIPEGTRDENPIGWRNYWLDSLADAGIIGLEPLANSWFVTLDVLKDHQALEILIASLLQDLEGEYQAEYIGPIVGGYVLSDQDKNLVWPGCCGDLSNLDEWRKAGQYRGEEWLNIWIGHPSISVRFESGKLLFSELHDPLDVPNNSIAFSLTTGELCQAISIAEEQLKNFSDDLESRLTKFLPPKAVKEAAKIFICGTLSI